MSLRARLVAAIVLALLLSFAAGAGLAAWQAARAVRTELAAALSSAGATAAADQAAPARIVASFDGNRHIRAQLTNPAGQILAASHPASTGIPPRWFQSAIAPTLAPLVLPTQAGFLTLTADATNESFERWSELREEVGLLALFFAAAVALSTLIASRALRPLTALAGGLARLGDGAQNVRVPAAGPPEVAALAHAFNTLSAALQSARAQNIRLQTQAALLAEEERAGIARDLHDEVGPLLFAISAFTATIARLTEANDLAGIPPHLAAIQDATQAIQSEVRDMLGRLHDVAPHSACLADLLENLAAFWRRVQPGITIQLALDPASAAITGPPSEILFRIAQESLSNAVRHGRPDQITLRVHRDGQDAILQVTDNGRLAGHSQTAPEPPGYGIAGMRARLAAAGGHLTLQHGAGWTVTARLPLHAHTAQPGNLEHTP
jgi:two-component system sensor histidine kinase UhpB